jgi:hypothetical protein
MSKFINPAVLVSISGDGSTPESEPTYHLNFDGVNDKVTVPHAASIDNLPLGDFTVEFAGTFALGVDGTIIGKQDGDYLGWEIGVYTDTAALEVTYDAFDKFTFSNVNLSSGSHHWEIVWQVSGRIIRIFKDGIELIPISSGSDAGGTYDDDSLHDMLLFTLPGGAFKSGGLNWLRVSNIARHTSNFTAPSLTVCPATDANTVVRLALDEGTGTTANDTSGNNNNGTIDGATWEADS